jgi:protein TonB
METQKILSADLLDLLFEGRNKDYGAYELRKTYNRRISIAIGGTLAVCLLFLGGSILASKTKNNKNEIVVVDMTLEKLPEEKKPEPPVIPPPKQEPPKVEMERFVAPKIVVDNEVKPEDEMKDMDKLEEVKISTIHQEGVKDDGAVAPPVEKGTGTVEAPKKEEDLDHIFYDVQIPAEFEGGIEGWRKYLERNLKRDTPSDNGAPNGSYTVTISFTVDREGNISDVKAENDPGYGTKAEALRVILKGPKWKPAVQNGTKVMYRHKQNITFKVEEG